MPFARINNVNLYYEVHGTGAPVLLVAGLASDSQSWEPVTRELSRYYTVVAPDNRGVGRTDPADADSSISLMADDCIGLMDYLKLPSVHILGHSMGGFIAMDCALRYPWHVDRLILAATAAFNSKRNNTLLSDWVLYLESGMDLNLWFRNMFYWIFSKDFFENEEFLDEAIGLARDYPYLQSRTGFRKQVQAITEYNCLPSLSAITAKTLVISGSEDLLFSPQESVLLAERIPDARFTLIEKAAHSIHREYLEVFTGKVRDFLSGQ